MVQPYEQRVPEPGGPAGQAGPVNPAGPAGGAEAARPPWFKDVFNGVAYLFRGLAWVARHPAQWLFGLVPALIVLAAYAAALAALAWNLGDLAGWVTPFADGWTSELRDAARIVAGVAIFGAALFLAVVTFTAVTLLVGEPFYESIAVRVEDSRGGAPPDPDVPLLTTVGRAVADAIVLGLIALLFAVVFFACGFLPVVGQTVVPVAAACVSGYLLAGELTSIALGRRGLLRRERFAVLRRYRPLAVGFGAATFVTFLVPLAAVVMMPAAVAGATLMVRERLIVS